jgi:hypothetical protein
MADKPTLYTRGRFQLKYRGTECLNCGHPLDLSDRYCPFCAQANSTKKVAIRDFFDEFFSNVLSYDSRLLRTFSSIALRPGFISKEYIRGRRMSYSNPFRFMLSLAIIYFLMLGIVGNLQEMDRLGVRNENFTFDPGQFINITSDTQVEDELRETLDSLDVADRIANYRHRRDSLIVNDPGGYFGKISDSALFIRLGRKHLFFTTLLGKDSLYGFQDAIVKYNILNNMENKLAFSMARSTLRVSRQPGSFANDLISRLPFATFFFLPIFAFFIVMVYIRKKYTYTDNLIFSFHNQSLLFILLIISFLIDEIFNISTAWIALIAFSIYLYKAMRNFYGQGRFKTILKFLFLNTVYLILAGTAGVLFVLASAFTY